MALNKILEGILKDFSEKYNLHDLEISKQFEYLVNYLLVSKYHPDAFSDKGDLDILAVDNKGQFGLDAIAFIVNGNLVLSKDDIKTYAKSNQIDVDIIFIQSKTSEKYESGELLKTIQATKYFLNDFDKITEKNENMLNAKQIYDELFEHDIYRYCTSESPRCAIYYVTTANDDNSELELIKGICKNAQSEIKSGISDIKKVEVRTLGREYIIESYREITNSVKAHINLKNCITLEKIEGVKEAYLGYLSGEDYLKIICDLDGNLRRQIFYDNVRDYQGTKNRVNTEIRETINKAEYRDRFIILNNGVTMITKSVVSLGANEYEISDFQIVNGCQTSNEIFNCKENIKDVFVPIKIIYTIEPDIISSIVKATNRQSPVPEEAFVALGTYHKELQLLFSKYSEEMPLQMFYERRAGESHDIRDMKGRYQVVTLHGLIRAVESVYFQKPNFVYKNNPANILKIDSKKLFDKNHKHELYYIGAYLFLKFVYMQQQKIFSSKDYKIRYYIIMVARCLLAGSLSVPHFASKEMKIECNNIIEKLKNESDQYFINAKDIINKTLEECKCKGCGIQETLKSDKFCEKVKENIRMNLNEKGQKSISKNI